MKQPLHFIYRSPIPFEGVRIQPFTQEKNIGKTKMPLSPIGRVRKEGKRQKRKNSYTKSQRIKDNESILVLDRSIQNEHRQLREQAENPIPKPRHQKSHPEDLQVLLKMNELARSSIAAKPHAASELNTRKRYEAAVLSNLLNGLNTIEVSSKKALNSEIQRVVPSKRDQNYRKDPEFDI